MEEHWVSPGSRISTGRALGRVSNVGRGLGRATPQPARRSRITPVPGLQRTRAWLTNAPSLSHKTPIATTLGGPEILTGVRLFLRFHHAQNLPLMKYERSYNFQTLTGSLSKSKIPTLSIFLHSAPIPEGQPWTLLLATYSGFLFFLDPACTEMCRWTGTGYPPCLLFFRGPRSMWGSLTVAHNGG